MWSGQLQKMPLSVNSRFVEIIFGFALTFGATLAQQIGPRLDTEKSIICHKSQLSSCWLWDPDQIALVDLMIALVGALDKEARATANLIVISVG